MSNNKQLTALDNYFLGVATDPKTKLDVLIATKHVEDFYYFVMHNEDAKMKIINTNFKVSNLSKTNFYKRLFKVSKSLAYRYLERISTTHDLSRKYRSLLGVSIDEWEAFLGLERSTIL